MATLENRKLKVWNYAPSEQVMVIQDGTAADSDSDLKWDDGFRLGCDPGASTTNGPDADKFYVRMNTLSNDYDNGHRLTFTITGRHAWWSMNDSGGFRCMPGDKVEFWADRGAQPSTTLGTMPSWTLERQSAGQVRWFYGWVASVSPESASGEVQVECHSALVQANRVRMVRSTSDGLTIPKLALNVDDPASPEFFYSIKKKDASGSPILSMIGTGIPKDRTAYLLTLDEILQFLEAEYGSALVAAGLTASTTIWDSTERAKLTMKPQPVIVNDVGFTDLVRQLLRWAPNVRLMHDPRLLKFRLQEVADGFTSTSTTLSGGSAVGATTLNVANPALFSATPGADGNRGMVGGYANIEEFAVSSIDGSALTISSAMLAAHPTSSVVQPIKGTGMSTVTASYDTDVAGDALSLRVDLDGSYSSVRLQSIQQEQGNHTATYDPSGAGGGGLAKGWNSAFDSSWKPGDENRDADYGVGGLGIPVHKTDALGGSGKIRLWLSYTDCAFFEDHENDEWVGASVFVLTADNDNARSAGYAFAITDNTEVADIDNGEKGMTVTIDTTDLAAAVGGTFLTEATAGGGEVADRIALTADFQFSTTTNLNQRASVGRLWYFTDANVERAQTDAAHMTTCNLPKIYVSNGSADGRRQVAQASGMGYPAANAGPVGQWEALATGGVGAFHVFRRSFHTEAPVFNRAAAPCSVHGMGGWLPPSGITATVEYTTTTVREARFPASGEAGYANTYFNLELTKELSSDNWTRTDQDAHYEDLVERLWDEYQNPHFTGSAAFIGTNEWGWALDLCHRVAFSSQMGVAGGGDILRKFWGITQSVTVDLQTDQVQAEFDNLSPLADLAMQVVEDWGVDREARLRAGLNSVRLATELPACIAGMGHIVNMSAPSSVCGGSIQQETRNINVNIGIRKGKETALGLGETGIAVEDPLPIADGSVPNRVSTYTTHGTRSTSTIERDTAGALWYMSPGGVFPATAASGGKATVSTGSASHAPLTIPGENANAVAQAMAAVIGLTPATSTPPSYTYVASSSNSSPNTIFVIGHTALSSAVGGELHVLDYDEDNPRAGYTITAHSGANVTVALISEALPPNQTPAVVYYKGAPTLNPAAGHFTSGGLAFTDSGGNYVVYDAATSTLMAATLSGNELSKQGGASNARTVKLGPAVDANIAVDWGSNASTGFLKDIDLNDLANVDDSTRAEGSLPYWDATSSTWKTTGANVTFNDVDNRLEQGTDATAATLSGLLRLSQLSSTSAGAAVGAKAVGIQDAGTYTAQTTVEAALQEIYGKLKAAAWSMWVPMRGTQVQDTGSGTLTNSGASIATNTDYDGHAVIANFASSNKEGFAFSFVVPSDLDTSAVVTAKLYYKLSGAVGTRHATYFGIDARAVADTEAVSSGGSLANVATVKEIDDDGYSSGRLVVHSVGTLYAASTLAAGDYVKGIAYRDPTNADDDYTGTCQFIGCLFQGTRSL